MLCWKLFYLEFPYTLFHNFIPSAGEIEKTGHPEQLKAESSSLE